MVKRLIADGVAVAIAGTREPAPALIASYVREQGCREQSTVWGFGLKTSPAFAAFANAASMHVLDFEPMSSPPTHAVSPTVPVAFALGEALGASGREMLTACAKGFEMQGRVLAASALARGSLPFHTPGVVGVMGCVDPGMAIKFYPSKYPTHFVITAALELHASIGDPRTIQEVRIRTPDIDDADRPLPRSGLEGKFSFQYTASVALLDGKVGIASFTDERRFAPDLVDLLGKCVVERDPTKSNDTRSMQVEIQVLRKDGRTLSALCSRPPGSWGQPIDPLQHGTKVRDCLSVRFDAGQVEQIITALDDLERASPADVAKLVRLLG